MSVLGSVGTGRKWIVLLAAWLIVGIASTRVVAARTEAEGADAFRLAIVQLAEPLVRTRPTTAAEDQDLAAALARFRARAQVDDLAALEAFLDAHPDSGWAPALHLNVGLTYRHYGYVTRAGTAWRAAWRLGRAAQDPEARALVDRAVGELALLLASLGDSDALATLFAEIGARPVTGPATEKIQVARETLDLVTKDPRHLFNCGPLALRSLLVARGGSPAEAEALRWLRVGPNGTSLAEVSALASKAGAPHRLVRREPGQPVPVPSVMHFRAGHFAAIVAAENGRFHLHDPVLGGQELWLTTGAVDAEASGYFLVPDGAAKTAGQDWREVAPAEAGQVWGKGPTNGVVPGDAGDPLASAPSPNCGMCGTNIKEATVGLTLSDMPVGYVPAIGPEVRTRISYNQREDSQPSVFGFFNLGPKWTINWLSYVSDDPQNPGGNVSRVIATGGAYFYTGYSGTTGAFAPQSDDGSVLTRAAESPIAYRRRLRDGTTEIYAESDGSTGFPRRIFLSKVVDPQGNALSFTYDAQLRLTALTDAVGRQTRFGYGQPGRPLLLTQITDPFGRSASLSYDGLGRLSAITDVIGLTSRFTYDANGLVTALTTPYGTTRFAFTAPGTSAPPRFVDVTDPLGFHEREEWLEPAPIPDSEPAATVPQGMPVAPANQYLTYRNSFHWDKDAYEQAGCTPAGGCDYAKARLRHFVHAGNGIKGVAIESEKQPLENRVWYNYPGQTDAISSGAFNRPSAVARVLDDGTTQLTRFDYDTTGYNLSRIVDPLGRTTHLTYAPNGIDLLAVTQVSGPGSFAPLAQFTYDGQHRPIVHTDAAGATSTFAYNAAGQLTAATNALNETTRFTYDPAGNLLSVVNATGASAATFTYDAADRVRTYTDSEGWTVTYAYDAADRITAITYPDGTSQTYSYDRLDLVGYRDRQFRTWTYGYDANRRLTSLVDPGGSRMLFGYTGQGRLASLTDAKGAVTRWSYDVQGRPIAKRYADGSTVTSAYETATSRLKSVTDALSQVKQYSYARDDRLSGISYPNALNATPAVTFADDPFFPRTLSMSDGTGTTRYSYAPSFAPGAQQLARECLVPAGAGDCAWSIAYTYDALGRMIARSVSGSGPETVAYDALGRITRHGSDLGSFALSYLGQTEQPTLRQLLPAGASLATTWSYLPNAGDRRLAGIAHTGLAPGQFLTLAFTSAPETLITGVTETSDVPSPVPPAGSQTAQYNVLNQLTGLSGQALTYDANGNLVSDGPRVFAWDAEDRLVRITYPAQPGKVSSFTYDGLGRRVTIGSTPAGGAAASVTAYVWCGESLCQSRTQAGAVLRSYLAEGEVAAGAPGQRFYYGIDQIGSVRRAFASAGGAPAFAYDPYGNALQGGAPVTDFGFAGMFYHAESGLYLTHFRAYDPAIGRWISRDPIGELADVTSHPQSDDAFFNFRPFDGQSLSTLRLSAGAKRPHWPALSTLEANRGRLLAPSALSLYDGLSLYSYVAQNPLARTDPQGLSGFRCDGFSAGCQSGGTYGTTAMYCVRGRKLCFDCAVKYLGLDGEPNHVKLKALERYLIEED
ncbi:YD repeat-containing protein [Methylobacterium sp. 4-46]|uniref:RHS repeat-associated core domain-containing protein n=1 Tax=unclassified Methylobacterium TaxID=2615210 RepID=UPI000152CC9D|nr:MULTISPECIES: RHS repeat-associated core domain-containing protein [Methylobacterium]ACA20387.1 YD repeat-containing protein [Methylobacterium sp. 4-46]WFT79556.1 RHS repeat-associated core domain-containing protein [Methylobacterium nodulans]